MKKRNDDTHPKDRHRILMLILVVLVMATVAAIVFTSVVIFKRTTRSYREQTIINVSTLAAEQIDGDKVVGWLSDGADEAYMQTGKLLSDILANTANLQYLYVYRILPDGCHVVFDFDTTDDNLTKYDERPDVDASALGNIIEFDESFEEYLPTLLSGGRIDTIESNDTYGWLLTRYEPVFASDGSCVAYVGADISMQGIHDHVRHYILQIAVLAAIFFIGCILVGSRLYIGVRRADEMDGLIQQQQRDKKLTREIIEAFAKVVDLKDTYTQGHSFRVARYTEMLAREMGCDEKTVEMYHNIALMHDIGKIGVPDSVLNKPGKLTDEEFDLIKSHAERGYEVLKNISLMPEIPIGARSHHERPDGKGYPLGLKGDEIPPVAKIIAVADCFDAMYSNRPYRPRMNFEKVVFIIKEVSGTQLSPDVVDAFLRLVDKGEFRDPDDNGGGSTETIENIRK